MKQYLNLANRIIDTGSWVENERTGKRCLTVINADLEYNVKDNIFPLITTRKSYWKSAIAEFLGYIRGYNTAEDFRELGCNTWNANANDNNVWLENPFRKGTDDMGKCYGAIGRNMNDIKIVENITKEQKEFLESKGYEYQSEEDCTYGGTIYKRSIDQLQKVVNNLSKGIDDRFETITFHDPKEQEFACLRPCMHTHTFSVIGDTLHLTSYQRSCDVPLGLNFNQVQVFFFLAIMAQITGLKAGTAYHKIINAHIYEDQLDLMKNVQIKREPFNSPKLHINPEIISLKDLETWVTLDDFEVEGYEFHEPIKYPFSV